MRSACSRVGTRAVAAAAYGRGGGSPAPDPDYYGILGLEPDCDEDDIRAAFRRRAKEIHPDVNKEASRGRGGGGWVQGWEPGDDATQAFVQLSRAYEVLSDPEARRQYDIDSGVRRLNFFRDVYEDEDDRRSPFRWSRVGARPSRPSGPRPFDDGDEDDGHAGSRSDDFGDEREGGGGSSGADDEDEDGGRDPNWKTQEELLQELAKFMSGPGSLRAWQSGRTDPWGNSTSDSWFRQVERQTRSPYGPSRTGYGSSRDDDDGFGGNEWDPSRRTPGWSPPGRGSEWNHPRRQWDEEDRRGGGPPGRQSGGGGDFRRPFKI
ncbi:hypothetical protein GPECTOR_45g174 [Gonium pectorale]|uniref:J domain-containing protein n=1 Tax=Gonium pectorale TaxID=33097 RepID=A0A150G8Z1_GONPE|nr:hypothetical protein GPECTOR_45g174 [Gonium pectorale]|eukprot:KXZ46304.1 hypothetical protein GPECTOR_45g174 [Gonium pectorale]